MQSTRLIGVAIPDVSDWKQPRPAGKWSQFFRTLAARASLIDVIQPRLSRRHRLLNLAVNFHPSPSRWRARSGFNPALAEKVTQAVEHELAQRTGSYDLVIQLQTLCAPGTNLESRPFAIYTDNTFALTQRFYPQSEAAASARVRGRLAFEAEVCRAARAVFTFSEFARRSMIEDYGCEPSRVSAIGAGANQLQKSVDAKEYSRPLALFVGMNFERKGGPTLLQAWPAVRARIPNAELVIAGPRSGPPRSLESGIRWVGRVNRDRLERLYESASVFVMPSIFEPWGFVFAEAMGYGLPCIGASCCAMPELIEDGITGRLVAPNDPDALAEALSGLLADPSSTQEMGHAAHARVLARLTWDQVVERLVSHLA